MDLIDLWWNLEQQQAIRDLRAGLHATGAGTRATVSRQEKLIALLQQENDDLRLRLAVLVRLLTAQGTISKEQFDAAMTEAKTSLAAAQAQMNKSRAATPRPRPKKLGPTAK